MAWTTPGTATAGQVLTAAFWNAQVRDNLLALGRGIRTYTIDTNDGVQNAGEGTGEIARQTSTAISTLADHLYLIVAWQTVGAGGTANNYNLRIRRGTTTAGTLIGHTRTYSPSGQAITLIAFGVDTPGAQASQQYCTTVQASAAAYDRRAPAGIIVIDLGDD